MQAAAAEVLAATAHLGEAQRRALPLHEVWIYGGTSEIMKTIIARDLTGLRA